MSTVVGFNKFLGCTPFERKSVEAVTKAGFATVKQRSDLTELTVLFGTPEIPAGSKVYVPASAMSHPWAKEDMVMDEQKFILVPQDMVRLVRLNVPKSWRPEPTPIPGPGIPITP